MIQSIFIKSFILHTRNHKHTTTQATKLTHCNERQTLRAGDRGLGIQEKRKKDAFGINFPARKTIISFIFQFMFSFLSI